MYKYHGIKAEIIKNIFLAVMGVQTVHADEGTSNSDSNSGSNFEALIAKAREEEKAKLYPQINKLKEQNSSLVEACSNHIKEIESLKKELKELKEKPNSQQEEIKALNAKISTLEGEKEVLQGELSKFTENPPVSEEELRKTIRAEIESEYEVKDYAKEQLSANSDKILKSFANLVTGSTKEEVDKAVASAIEKSNSIRKELGLIDDEGNPITKKTHTPKKPKTASPSDSTPERTFDPEYIRGLDPNSQEYRDFRASLGLK